MKYTGTPQFFAGPRNEKEEERGRENENHASILCFLSASSTIHDGTEGLEMLLAYLMS